MIWMINLKLLLQMFHILHDLCPVALDFESEVPN